MKFTNGKFANQNRRTHGKSRSRAYICWHGMNQRCYDFKRNSYPNYGARGIKVLWTRFEDFYADMGDPPSGMTIERINNNGHYCKENCCWATRKEQSNNRRYNRLITFEGKTQNLNDWAKEKGLKYRTLHARIRDYNWPIEKALLCASH